MTNDSGRDPLGQALAVPVEPVARLDPTGFDPSREEWASPELRNAERRILLAMYEGVDPDFGFFPFKSIASTSATPLDLVKPLVRLLARSGEATFMRGLMNEDGEMIGSGYGLTEKGRARASAIATEAGTAETENTGSVHEGAGLQGIAQPQSVSGLSHTGGDRG